MIIQFHDLPPESRDLRVAQFGGFDELPPNWREISAAEFSRSAFFSCSSVMIEQRNMKTSDPTRPFIQTLLFWQPELNSGYSIVNDPWAGSIRFYHFGCDHEWVKRPYVVLEAEGHSINRNLNVRQCVRCQRVWQFED